MLVTRTLDIGGAERQLVNLALGLNKKKIHVSVLTFYSGGRLSKSISEAGICIHSLNKSGRWDLGAFAWRFFSIIHRYRPTVLYGILDVPNILILLVKIIRYQTTVVWGLPASDMNYSEYGWGGVASNKLECWLSRFPDLVITNSKAGRDYAIRKGYVNNRFTVIQNGINTNIFKHDENLREQQRMQWSVECKKILVGIVARLDPVKDHYLFIDTAAIMHAKDDRYCFVCVGSGPGEYQQGLEQYANSKGLHRCLIWAGEISNMAAAYNALDIMALTSQSEGLPNVLGEAMACCVPCVVTDVGDAADIVSDTGVVIHDRVPQKIANGCYQIEERLKADREGLKKSIRQRIIDHYDLDLMIQSTLDAIHPNISR